MTFTTFLGYAKRIGTALGAWMWLIKILMGVLGCLVLFVSVKGWRDADGALATLTEEHTRLQGEVVAHKGSAARLRQEKAEILASSEGLQERYAALEAKVGKLQVTGTLDVSTPHGGAIASGAPREPAGAVVTTPTPPAGTAQQPDVLLRRGDKGHIRVKALTVETEAKNEVLLLEGVCYRDVPGPAGTPILRDTARMDLSEVLKLAPPGNPGVGVGPLLVGGRHGLTYGLLVSPATLNFKLIWNFQAELLLGVAGNATGDWQIQAGGLLRPR